MTEFSSVVVQWINALVSLGAARPFYTTGVIFVLGLLSAWGAIHGILRGASSTHLELPQHSASRAPALGGLGMSVAVTAVLLLFMIIGNGQVPGDFLSNAGIQHPSRLMLGFLLVHLVGVYDDFFDLAAIPKLLLQFAVAALIVSSGVVLGEVSLFHGGAGLSLGALGFPLTVFWFVAVGNAVNLIDGMDGMAGSVVLTAAAGFGVWSFLSGSFAALLAAALLCGVLFGFLLHNRPPARIIMGDGGSLLIGYTVALLPLLQLRPAGGMAAFALLPIATVLCIPALDTASAIVRRTLRGKAFHVADREHIHHKLQYTGRLPAQVLPRVYLWGVVAVLFGSAGLFLEPALAVALQLGFWAVSVALVVRLYRQPAAEPLPQPAREAEYHRFQEQGRRSSRSVG